MAILGYNDVLQLPAGPLSTWNQVAATVGAGCAGAAVAALPVTNLLVPAISRKWRRDLTGATPGGLTGTVIANIELIPGWLNSGYNINNIGLIGVLGLRSYVGDRSAGQEYDLQVRVKGSSVAFGNTDAFDQTRTFYANEFPGAFPRQVWFENVPSDSDPLAGSAVGAQGGRTPARYWQIEVTSLQTPPAPWSVEIGRVVFFNAFVATYTPSVDLNYEDQSEVTRAFGGYPYVLRAGASRAVAGEFINLPDQAIFGHSALEASSSVGWGSTVTTINKLAGKRGEVVLIPQIYSKAAGTGGRMPSAWQTQPVYGLLDNGIRAQRLATTSSRVAPGSSVGALWSASFSITETPMD